MAGKREAVLSGLECEGLTLRARAYVNPARLAMAEEEARTCGRIRLALTDRLAIDVSSKDGDFRPVIGFVNTDEDRHLLNGVIEWSVQCGSFAAYASDAEMLFSTGRSIQRAIDDDAYVLLEQGEFSFARVGDIVVIFEKDGRKKESSSDDEADDPASKGEQEPHGRRTYAYLRDPDLKEPLGATIRPGQPYGFGGRA